MGRILFSSRKELLRKARKRDELEKFKEQIKNDSVTYCTSSNKKSTTPAADIKPNETVGIKTGEDVRKKNSSTEIRRRGRKPGKADGRDRFKNGTFKKKDKNNNLLKKVLVSNALKRHGPLKAKHKRSKGRLTLKDQLQHKEHRTISKTQRKLKNPRKITNVNYNQWGHVQGQQFSLRTLDRTSLVIFDPCGAELYDYKMNCDEKVEDSSSMLEETRE